MVGVYIAFAVLGVILMVVFVDELPYNVNQQGSIEKTKDEVQSLLLATLNHMRRVNQLLLIPVTLFSGLEQGFIGAEFNEVKIKIIYIIMLQCISEMEIYFYMHECGVVSLRFACREIP